MRTRPRLVTLAATALTATVVALTGPGTLGQAQAHGDHKDSDLPDPKVLADGLVSPLQVAVTDHGTAYVTQNFAGQLLRIERGDDPEVVYTAAAGRQVAGVSVSGRSVKFLLIEGGQQGITGAWLMKLRRDGTARELADLLEHEEENNPDQITTYGFRKIGRSCLARWPEKTHGPARYKGVVESNPYATTQVGKWTYVADAAANAILAVSPWGDVHTVAVMPAIPFRITAAVAADLGLHRCFIGKRYWFEFVPTDVELGDFSTAKEDDDDERWAKHRKAPVLYVSSLPGGPESPALGARGGVFKVVVGSGHVRRVVSGFLGATGLAVGPGRALYVAEMFGNEISRVTFRDGRPKVRTVATPTTPGDVEAGGRWLYATVDVLSDPPAGQLVKYRVRHYGH